MISKIDFAALLKAIQDLFFKIASLGLRSRMDSYREQNGASPNHDISSTMAANLEKITPSESASARESTETSTPETAATPQPRSARIQSSKKPPSESKWRFPQLSQFFGRRRADSISQPYMSEKLKSSVWEHINKAHRFARQGQTAKAKVYAELANLALQETAKFLPDDEYAEFYAKVEGRLKEFQP